MSSNLPQPPVPSDIDLTDFSFMPVDIERLFKSGFHAMCNAVEWRAGVTLWLRSFQQIPASSLPADDRSLALIAEFGRELPKWRKAKLNALRGWYLCDDGRLYHRVVSEKALEAWIERLLHRKSSSAGNASRWNGKYDPSALEEQIQNAAGLLRHLNPESRSLKKRGVRIPTGNPNGSASGSPGGSASGNAPGVPSRSQGRRYSKPSQDRSYLGSRDLGDLGELGTSTTPGGMPAMVNGSDPGWDDDAPFGEGVSS